MMALMLVAGQAMATSAALQTVLDNITIAPIPGDSSIDVTTDYVADTWDSYWNITGTGGSVSTMIIELASFAPNNIFGVYDPANPATRVPIFLGPDVAGTQKTLSITALGDVYINHADTGVDFTTTTFGFYQDSTFYATGGLWFSYTPLNSDGMDHMYAYQGINVDTVQIPPWGPGLWTDSEFVVAFEDLDASVSDWDFTDMVVMVESVNPIPEPGTLLLLGLGLIGVVGIGRKKFKF
jgi:hypothetical protein